MTRLRLYVAGDAPNSQLARENLDALLDSLEDQTYDLEIVDCLADPLRSMQDGIVVTPTLVKIEPEPRRTVIGSLSDAEYLRRTIGI